MKKYPILWLYVVALAMTFTSCSIATGIFKAGFYIGIFVVILVVVLILWLVNRK